MINEETILIMRDKKLTMQKLMERLGCMNIDEAIKCAEILLKKGRIKIYHTYDKDGYDENGYDIDGYNREGYGIDGYNREDFNIRGLHRNGTYFDNEGYGIDGFNKQGLDKEGYNRGGFNEKGIDRGGYDKYGFNKYGIDRDGYNKRGYNQQGYDRNGFNEKGIDKEGYNREGFNKYGFNRSGYNKEGYNKEGYNKFGYDIYGYDKDGYDESGYDKDGYNKRGFDKNGFDMQGYNEKCEYFEFINKYIDENIKIKVINNKLIYSDEIRELFIDIERSKRSIIMKDYIASISHLRRAAEKFLDKVFIANGVLPYKFINLNQYERIEFAKNEDLLSDDCVKVLNIIRENGNLAVHEGEADKELTENILGNLQKEIHKWIENYNI